MEKQIDLNPSSLLDLKAELHKKYETFRRAKVVQESQPEKQPTAFKRKGELPSKDKKPKLKSDTSSTENADEEEADLKKSRLALEAKAKLYEKLSRSNELIDDEEGEHYLVDFNRKILYETPVTTEEKSKVSDNLSQCNEDDEDNPVYSSSDLRKIYQRKPETPSDVTKTLPETEEEEAVHYQNVQFNEVRDHGTGYFAFSKDESIRKEQMEELRNLRQQTEEQRMSSKNMQKKRTERLKARLAKVCERRNIDKSVIKNITICEEPDDTNIKEENIDLSSIPIPEPIAEKKPVKVRPWDVGKTEFTQFVPAKRKLKSQRDYIEERRSDRLSEFAPPTVYK